jgi:hypothetical protein
MQNNKIQQKQIISVYLDMDFELYKEKIKQIIFKHLGFIYEIFSEEFNDNFVKFFILYKKGLINSNYKKYVYSLINFFDLIINIQILDQEEYFSLLIKLINVYVYAINFSLAQESKYIKMINIDLMNQQIISCVKKITEDNVVFQLIIMFINNKNTETKKNIIYIGEKLSFDLFVYFSAKELFVKITNEMDENNNLFIYNLKKYKHNFINSYKVNSIMLKDLYFEQNIKFSITKYLIEMPKKILELSSDINLVKKELKKK